MIYLDCEYKEEVGKSRNSRVIAYSVNNNKDTQVFLNKQINRTSGQSQILKFIHFKL